MKQIFTIRLIFIDNNFLGIISEIGTKLIVDNKSFLKIDKNPNVTEPKSNADLMASVIWIRAWFVESKGY